MCTSENRPNTGRGASLSVKIPGIITVKARFGACAVAVLLLGAGDDAIVLEAVHSLLP